MTGVDLRCDVPAVCAQLVASGAVDIGLVPVAEIARQGLEIVPGVGISAEGPVRSILLFARTEWKRVRTVAVDSGSRTSVELARVILRERFGVEAETFAHEPDLERMLGVADAALLIGDAALRIDPLQTNYACLDLADEWFRLTGRPFLFAAWAGKAGIDVARLERLTVGAYELGREHLNEIVETESRRRRMSRELVDDYLRHKIRYLLSPREFLGMEEFFKLSGLALVAQ